jgi:ankyrin repeat protein
MNTGRAHNTIKQCLGLLLGLMLLPYLGMAQATSTLDEQLMEAAWRGNLTLVKTLLSKGADVNTKNTYGRTPLWSAINGRKADVVKLLLHGGADVNAADKNGSTPLLFAEQQKYRHIVRLLRARGAHMTLPVAAIMGDQREVQKLLDAGKEGVNSRTEGGYTPLMWASERGHAKVVKLLLDRGADVNAANDSGRTALLLATRESYVPGATHTEKGPGFRVRVISPIKPGHKAVLQLLLDAGADVNAGDTNGRTPLYLATGRGADVMKMLLEKGGDVNTRDKFGNTLLIGATRADNVDIVKMLLDKGADVNAAASNGETALIKAAQRGDPEVSFVITKLLLDNEAKVNISDECGRTALMWAASRNLLEVVKLLRERGAEITFTDAARLGDLDAIKRFTRERAEINATGSIDNVTPLMSAARRGRLEAVKMLLNSGADVNARARDLRTALMEAAGGGNLHVVQLLLDKGADLNARTCDGETVLMQAASGGNAEVVKVFLDKGVNIDARTRFGHTALMSAVEARSMAVVKSLLDRGASVNFHRATDSATALKLARQNRLPEIVKLLEARGFWE